MSIIYDALKKIEPKPAKADDSYLKSPSPQFIKPKIIPTVCIICVLSLLAVIGLAIGKHYRRLRNSSISMVQKKPTASQDKPVVPSAVRQGITPTEEKAPVAVEKKTSIQEKAIPSLSINGIFFSDGEYLALIDNQIVKTGDSLEGVEINKIDFDGVEITFEGSSLKLNYP